MLFVEQWGPLAQNKLTQNDLLETAQSSAAD